MKVIIFILLPLICLACREKEHNSPEHDGNIIVRIETEYGNIDIKLYNETPIHRDNFVNLVKDGFYDDLLFHRVINNFMIQGGDPQSLNAEPGTALGSGGPGYTVPAEISDNIFHKKGALAAARLGDNVNPDKESSGSQFYIVHGAVLSEVELNEMESERNYRKKQSFAAKLYRELEREYLNREQEPDYEEITERIREIADEHFKNDNNLFNFSEEQVKVYTTTGGAPHLDGSYTVFGETIEGFDVIDSIAAVKTNNAARPLKDITMNIIILKENS